MALTYLAAGGRGPGWLTGPPTGRAAGRRPGQLLGQRVQGRERCDQRLHLVRAGLRGMFRQSGSILTLSATTALLALLATAHDPGVAQSRVFLVFAVLMVGLIPLILVVPDHHGQW